jgi:hypothetical protein
VLDFQVKLSFALISTLIITGFIFPLIHYSFHGSWGEVSNLIIYIFSAKAILAFIGLVINSHGVFVLNPEVQRTFATFTPDEDPPDELLNKCFQSQDIYIHSGLMFWKYLDPKLENLSDMEILDVGGKLN